MMRGDAYIKTVGGRRWVAYRAIDRARLRYVIMRLSIQQTLEPVYYEFIHVQNEAVV